MDGGLDPAVERYLKELKAGARDLASDIKGFALALADRPPITATLYVGSVKRFLGEHGYKLADEEWKRIRKRLLPKSARPVTFDEKPSKDQLKRILSFTSPGFRSLFLFLLSSGCRIGEALQLKLEDLKLDAEPPRANIRAEYTKAGLGKRFVFFSYEAKEAIQDWLRLRKSMRKRTPRRFIEEGMIGSRRVKLLRPVREYESFEDDRVWPFSPSAVKVAWHNALRKSGLDKRDSVTKFHIYHIHTLRKFFRSNIGLDSDITHALMGHAEYLDRAYRRYSEEELAALYKQAMGNVSIYEPSKPTISREEAARLELNTLITIMKAVGVEDSKILEAIGRVKPFYVLEAREGWRYQYEMRPGELIDMLETYDELMRAKEELLKLFPKPTSGGSDCPKQLMVSEAELEGYLNNGWVAKLVLPSGKVIVARS